MSSEISTAVLICRRSCSPKQMTILWSIRLPLSSTFFWGLHRPWAGLPSSNPFAGGKEPAI
jgi:hypothetical protein